MLEHCGILDLLPPLSLNVIYTDAPRMLGSQVYSRIIAYQDATFPRILPSPRYNYMDFLMCLRELSQDSKHTALTLLYHNIMDPIYYSATDKIITVIQCPCMYHSHCIAASVVDSCFEGKKLHLLLGRSIAEKARVLSCAWLLWK